MNMKIHEGESTLNSQRSSIDSHISSSSFISNSNPLHQIKEAYQGMKGKEGTKVLDAAPT